jgi:cbb3-type cytochrome oxidase subunit 3
VTPIEFSLVAVTVSFTGMVIWVYWPSRKAELESHGAMPLDDGEARNEETR